MADRCTSRKKSGEPCKGWRTPGSDKCRRHLFNPQARAKAAVRAEVINWGLGDTHVDPGEVLLRLVSQSAARAEKYAGLLEQAYEAAERLKAAHESHALVMDTAPSDELDGDGDPIPDSPAVQRAKDDLDRIFNIGGVAALVGNVYSASNSGALYATGEAIRGLTELEAKERDRCAVFAAKAIAAGLATRQVELAEKQGRLIADVLRAVLGDSELGLSAEQQALAPAAIRRHLSAVAS